MPDLMHTVQGATDNDGLRQRVASLEAALMQAHAQLARQEAEASSDAARQRTLELAQLNERLQQEIIEHTRTEHRLRASQRTLREAQRMAGVGSWEFYPDTGIAVWSDEMYGLTGHTSATFTPSLASIAALMPPEDVPLVEAAMAQARRTGRPTEYGHRILRADRAVCRLIGLCSFVPATDGHPEHFVGTARDVTGEATREEVVEQTLAGLSRLEDLVNRGPAVVVVWSTGNGNPVEFISENVDRFGYAARDVMAGRVRWLDMVDPPDAARLTAELEARLAEKRGSFTLTYRMKTRGGVVRWVREEITVLSRTAEGTARLESILLDITAERQAESHARELQALTETIIAAAPIGIAACDATGQCIFANPALAHIVNAPLDRILHRNIHHLPFWRQSRLLELAQATLATGTARTDIVRVAASPGGDTWLDCSFARFLSGEEPHLLVMFRDITDRQTMAATVEASERKYRQLFETMNEGFVVLDLVYGPNGEPTDARVTALNPAAATILGLDPAKTIGRLASEFADAGRPVFLDVYRALDGGGPPMSEERFIPAFNKHLFLSFFSPSKGRIASLFADITARKEAEERTVQYQQQLRHLASEISVAAEQERRRIAVDLHDGLGQTLALCKLKLESLRADADDSDLKRQLRTTVELMDEAIRDTRSLTCQLSPPVLYEIGLSAAIDWLAEQLAEKHGIPIRVHRRTAAEPVNMAMRVTLFQAARELILNTVKHAKATAIDVDIRLAEDHLEIAVEDNGAGFDVEAARSRARTGMGLFNVRERLQLVGGAMTLDSQPGRGTRAILAAPVPGETMTREEYS